MRLVLSAIVLTTTFAAPVRADRSSLHVTASGDVSATDNVFATTADQNEGDLFFTLRPGALLGYDAPRMSHDVALEGEIIEYLLHSDKPSISLRGGIRSSYVTSRYTNLVVTANGSNGVVTALSSRLSPDQTGPSITPLGRIDTIQGDAGEQLSWSSGRDYSMSQTLFARASRSDDNLDDQIMGVPPTIVTSAEAGGALGFERSFRRGDAVNFEAGASILRLERDSDPNSVLGPRLDRQINPRARAQWRHDFNRVWSGVADGGVVYVHPYGTDPDNPTLAKANGFFPVFGAGLAYTEVWGRAQLNVRRDVAPNLLVAQNTVNDSAIAQVAWPLRFLQEQRLRAPKLAALASLGLTRTQLIDPTTGGTQSEFLIARADIGVGWSPRPGFTYGVRYEFVKQSGDTIGEMLIPGFFRNTLSFTFQIRYPDRVAGAETPKRTTNSVRADGKDLIPIGVEAPPVNEQGDDSGGGAGGNEDKKDDE